MRFAPGRKIRHILAARQRPGWRCHERTRFMPNTLLTPRHKYNTRIDLIVNRGVE